MISGQQSLNVNDDIAELSQAEAIHAFVQMKFTANCSKHISLKPQKMDHMAMHAQLNSHAQ